MTMEQKTHILEFEGSRKYLTERQAEAVLESWDRRGWANYRGEKLPDKGSRLYRIPEAAQSLFRAALASGDAQPASEQRNVQAWWADIALRLSAYQRKTGRPVYSGLVKHAREMVGEDAGTIMEFIEAEWPNIQEYNKSTTRTRPDHDSHMVFEAFRAKQSNCGHCMGGWLPGNEGLVPCHCNKSVLEKIALGTVKDGYHA